VAIEDVEELHPEESLEAFGAEGDLFGDVCVFVEVGEFVDTQGAGCVAEGEVRSDGEGRGIEPAALAVDELSVECILIDAYDDVRPAAKMPESQLGEVTASGVPLW